MDIPCFARVLHLFVGFFAEFTGERLRTVFILLAARSRHGGLQVGTGDSLVEAIYKGQHFGYSAIETLGDLRLDIELRQHGHQVGVLVNVDPVLLSRFDDPLRDVARALGYDPWRGILLRVVAQGHGFSPHSFRFVHHACTLIPENRRMSAAVSRRRSASHSATSTRAP